MLVALLAGGCNQRHWVCEPAETQALTRLPERLSETGLYARLPSEALTEGVRAYRPAFELWSDSASKRRWLFLPAGAHIDTSDMDSAVHDHAALGIDFLAPLAGPLAGWNYSGGVSLATGW